MKLHEIIKHELTELNEFFCYRGFTALEI